MASYAFDEVGNLVRDTLTDLSTEEVAVTSLFYDDPNTSADDNRNRLWKSTYLGPEEDAVEVATYYGWDATNSWRTSQGTTATVANHEIQMTYNAQGRMSSYASPTITSATYTYDASGQRTKSIVTPAGGTATTTTYAYEGLTLLTLAASQGSDSWKIEYLHDEEGTPYGGVYRAPASSTSPTYFSIVSNDHGDVLGLCDADGAAFASYRYDAWGSPVSSSTQATTLITSTLAGEIASRQILRYASYAYDAESGFYYCSARYYDPATRQWTTGDPAKADGEESAYQYCGGEPVGRVDDSGLAHRSSSRAYHYDRTDGVNEVMQLRVRFSWDTNGRYLSNVRGYIPETYDQYARNGGVLGWNITYLNKEVEYIKAGGYRRGKAVIRWYFTAEYASMKYGAIWPFDITVRVYIWAHVPKGSQYVLSTCSPAWVDITASYDLYVEKGYSH